MTHPKRTLSAQSRANIAAGIRAVMPPLTVRFWAKVDKQAAGGCWQWTGAAHKTNGYGRFWVGTGKPIALAHRFSLELAGTPAPKGLYVDHVCRNRLCVNPEHLRAVTPAVNAIENNLSPLAKNKRKTHCKWGHEFTPQNTAMVKGKTPRGKPGMTRVCLTCQPRFWKRAIARTSQNPAFNATKEA